MFKYLLYCTSGLLSKKLPHVTLTVTKKEGMIMLVMLRFVYNHYFYTLQLIQNFWTVWNREKQTNWVTRPPYFTYVINPCTDNTYTFLFYAIGTKEVCPPSCCIVKREREGTLWVQCDGCQQWYHARCIGLSRKQLTRLDTFFCKSCE